MGAHPELAVLIHNMLLAGKPEASIKGIGIGTMAAIKLLRTYDTIDNVLAAASSDQLTGWGRNVMQAFGAARLESTMRLLQRNLRIFGTCSDEALVQPAAQLSAEILAHLWQGKQQQDAQQQQQQGQEQGQGRDRMKHTHHASPDLSRVNGGGNLQRQALAWMQPDNLLHWRGIERQCEALSARLQLLGASHHLQHVMPSGLTVDLVLPRPSSLGDSSCSNNELRADGDRASRLRPVAASSIAAEQKLSQMRLDEDSSAALPQSAASAPLLPVAKPSGIAVLLFPPARMSVPASSGTDNSEGQNHTSCSQGGTPIIWGWHKHRRTLLRRAGWEVVAVLCDGCFDAGAIASLLCNRLTALC